MSESMRVDTQASPTQTNGNGVAMFHGRIADLLDDVTVSARPVATAEEALDDLFVAPSPPPAESKLAESELAEPEPAEPEPAEPEPAAQETVAQEERTTPPPLVIAAVAGAAAAGADDQPQEDMTPPPDAADTMLPAAPVAAAAPPPELPPSAPAAAAMSYAAWVPPWDESQRPVTPAEPAPAPERRPMQGPETAAVAAAAVATTQPERSIFAPMAPPSTAPVTAPDTGTPPADLPPFLAAATIAAISEEAAQPPGAVQETTQVEPELAAVAATGAEPTADAVVTPAGAGDESGQAADTVLPAGATALISIRGRMDGLAIEVGDGPWPDVLAALTARLNQSATFFRNANVALELGQRVLTEDSLNSVAALLREHGMTLALVRTGAERTFQSALALGLTVTLAGADGAAMAEAAAAVSNAETAGYFVYRGYLRSGNRLRRQEHVLVIGDVNPGAEVISDGDILVWGRLRGLVHAGAGGNSRAIVAALDMEPTQLRIAEVMVASPDPQPGQPGKWFWQRSANKRPEVARIAQRAIVFEEWDTGRPGGLVSLRRGG